MNVLLAFFWPGFAAALISGAIAGTIVHRRGLQGRPVWLLLCFALVFGVACTLIWSGPLGAAQRFERSVDVTVDRTLQYYEMTQIRAHLGRAPLTRQLVLDGPADDFQRSELVRVLSDVPGVSNAVWRGDERAIPMIVEAAIIAAVGFLFGLLVAYLLQLRRRHNAQWSW